MTSEDQPVKKKKTGGRHWREEMGPEEKRRRKKQNSPTPCNLKSRRTLSVTGTGEARPTVLGNP